MDTDYKGFPDSEMLVRVHISDAVAQNKKYVDDRREGRIKSLKTKFHKLNSQLSGGIELNTIIGIAAMSGAGKSTIAKVIRDAISTMNTDMPIQQLLFNLEMLCHQQVARSVVTKTNTPLRKLYSVDHRLSDEEFQNLDSYYEELAKRDIFFVETTGNALQIAKTIYGMWFDHCRGTNKVLVYEIDHALLTEGEEGAQGSEEKKKIDALMFQLMKVKKLIAAEKGMSVGIVLSQMNREIESDLRKTVDTLHRPSQKDLFGASSIMQVCDYVLFNHIPARLGLPYYTNNKYPVRYRVPTGNPEKGKEYKVYDIPYFELIKNRSGQPDLTFPMYNKLEMFDFDEMESSVFNKLHQDFQSNPNEYPILSNTPSIDFTKQ